MNMTPKSLQHLVAKRDQYERGVRALVTAGARAGTLRAADVTIATRAFLGALNWTAHWFRPEGPQSPRQVAEQVADYAVNGLINERQRATGADRKRRADAGGVRAVQNAARGVA